MWKWLRRRRYERKNEVLACAGRDARWVERTPGDWWLVDSVELDRPYAPLRPIKRSVVWERDGMVMEHVTAKFDKPIPPAKKGLLIISGRDHHLDGDEISTEK